MPDLILAPIASKTCTRCGEIKRLCSNGRYICDPCNRARVLAYRAANLEVVQAKDRERVAAAPPEKKRAKHKAWRDANPEHVKSNGRATMKRLYGADPDKFRERSAGFYAANRDKCQATSNAWKDKNHEQVKQYAKDYRSANLPQVKESLRRWRIENKEHVAAYALNRNKEAYRTNPIYRLKHNIGCLIRLKIKEKGYTKRSMTHEILGCDWDFFKSHIERQFLKGMTWENRSDWHIDHITPVATATTEEEVLDLNHFTNLRPMWAKDNLAKGAQITHLI